MQSDDQHPSYKTEPTKSLTNEEFQRLEEEIRKHWITYPVLPEDLRATSAFDYAERQIKKSANDVAQRREEFYSYIHPRIEKLLGADIASSVVSQLHTNNSVSTAQHYIPLTPNSLNATLFNSLAYFDRTETDRKNVIVFACSGVSMSNPWYARGHFFHSVNNGEIIELPLNFFGRALDSVPVISADAYGKEVEKSVYKTIVHYRSQKMITKREFNKLNEFAKEILFTQPVPSQEKYIDQLTVMNFRLWKKLFDNHEGHVPNLIFLSQENIATDLIINYHLEADTIINNLIFNKEWHKRIYTYFNNIVCAFSVEKKYGTFLFWAISKETKSRTQLFMKEGVLTSFDGSIQLEVTPENIRSALQKQEILPNVMLTFIVLSMYYGFHLTGGLLQPAYLTQIKEAYINMMHELGLSDEGENASRIITNDATFTRPALAFLEGQNDQRVPASALDLYLSGSSSKWRDIIEASKKITMQEMYYRLYPDIYRNMCKNSDKHENLLAITERQIEKLTGIDKMIPGWTTLKNG